MIAFRSIHPPGSQLHPPGCPGLIAIKNQRMQEYIITQCTVELASFPAPHPSFHNFTAYRLLQVTGRWVGPDIGIECSDNASAYYDIIMMSFPGSG